MTLISLEGTGFSTSVLEWALPEGNSSKGDSGLKFHPCQDLGLSFPLSLCFIFLSHRSGGGAGLKQILLYMCAMRMKGINTPNSKEQAAKVN